MVVYFEIDFKISQCTCDFLKALSSEIQNSSFPLITNIAGNFSPNFQDIIIVGSQTKLNGRRI